jgi:reverse gyrase
MKTMVITPRSPSEFKFLSDLFKKLNIASATMTVEEMEDLGLAKMLKDVDKSKKVNRESIMKKLRS